MTSAESEVSLFNNIKATQLHACSRTCSACQLSARNGSPDFTVDTSSPSSFSKRPRGIIFMNLASVGSDYLPRLSVFRSGQLCELRFRTIHGGDNDDDDDDDDDIGNVKILTPRRVRPDNASSPVEPVAPWYCRRKINSRLHNAYTAILIARYRRIALEDIAYATTTLSDYREHETLFRKREIIRKRKEKRKER